MMTRCYILYDISVLCNDQLSTINMIHYLFLFLLKYEKKNSLAKNHAKRLRIQQPRNCQTVTLRRVLTTAARRPSITKNPPARGKNLCLEMEQHFVFHVTSGAHGVVEFTNA